MCEYFLVAETCFRMLKTNVNRSFVEILPPCICWWRGEGHFNTFIRSYLLL